MRVLTKIAVPNDVRFLSDWAGFELPHGLLEKGPTGCGGTTLFINGAFRGVLVSPRNKLIVCKLAQHANCILVNGRITADEVRTMIAVKADVPNLKILTTTDSFHKVKEAIGDMADWRVLVDEYHLLLCDSAFKSLTENKLLNELAGCPYVTYMSSTPLLDEVTSEIPELNGLPRTKLVWQNTQTINVHRLFHSKPVNALLEVIRMWESDEVPTYIYDDGREVKAEELIIYLNSVTKILNIVREAKLMPEQVNLVIADSSSNQKMVKDLGEEMGGVKYEIGGFPLKNEPNKQYTFCTSTAFQGCDCYSEKAFTIVVADIHSANTCLDIIYSLPQIAGRCRSEKNPFRNDIYLIYNTGAREMTDEEFTNAMAEKVEMTEAQIKNANQTEGKYRKQRVRELEHLQMIQEFANTFTYYDVAKDEFCFNHLAKLYEEHAHHVRAHVYHDGISVVREIEQTSLSTPAEESTIKTEQQLKLVLTRKGFEECCRRYVEAKANPLSHFDFQLQRLVDEHPKLPAYYNLLGAERIAALGYKEKYMMEEVDRLSSQEELQEKVQKAFPVGGVFTTDEVKEKLGKIYEEHRLYTRGKPRKPQATHLEKEFGLKTCYRNKKWTIQGHP